MSSLHSIAPSTQQVLDNECYSEKDSNSSFWHCTHHIRPLAPKPHILTCAHSLSGCSQPDSGPQDCPCLPTGCCWVVFLEGGGRPQSPTYPQCPPASGCCCLWCPCFEGGPRLGPAAASGPGSQTRGCCLSPGTAFPGHICSGEPALGVQLPEGVAGERQDRDRQADRRLS